MLFLILLGLTIFVIYLELKTDTFGSASPGLCVATLVLLPVTLWFLWDANVSIPITVSVLQKNIEVYEKQADDFEALVRSELDKYPQYEKEILASVDPAILLKYPELKSNETIKAGFESMIYYRSLIYEAEVKINRLRGNARKHNWAALIW